MMQGMRTARALFICFLAAAVLLAQFSEARAAGALSCFKVVPKPWVCLTIDDGCSTASIKTILKTLKKNKVKCTFFIVGYYLLQKDKQPLWRQAIRDGHEICYHSMYHKSVPSMSDKQIRADIAKWEGVARKVLGADYKIPKYARLPGGGGSRNRRVLKVFASKGYKVIYWSADTLTGAIRYGRSVQSYIKRKTKQGSIILTHFSGPDARALPGYIGWLKKKYKLGRISDAFAAPKPKPTATPGLSPALFP